MKTISKSLVILVMLLTSFSFVNAQYGWHQMNSGTTDQFNGVYTIDSLHAVAVGLNGNVFRTDDGGATWTQRVSNTTNTLAAVTFPDANTGYAVGFNGTIIKSNNGGVSWTAQTSGTTEDLCAVSFIDVNTGYAVGGQTSIGKIFKTTNGGTTWSPVSISSGVLWTCYFLNANTGWVAGSGKAIYKTTDGGSTWTSHLAVTLANVDVNSIQFLDANTGYIAMGDGIEKTTDGGLTYSEVYSVSGLNLFSLSFVNTQKGWTVGTTGALAMTTNGGANWTTQSGGGSGTNMCVHMKSGTLGYAVGSDGFIIKYAKTYSATFHVKDNTSAPINGASVTFNGNTQTTNASGNTTFSNFIAGTYPYSVSKAGYVPTSSSVIEPGNDPVQVTLSSLSYIVSFHVKDNTNAPVQNASVTFNGQTQLTNSSGMADFFGVTVGNNQAYSISKSGFNTASGSINVNGSQTLNVTLTPVVANTYDITFHVTDNSSNDLQGASVTFDGSTKTTDVSGQAVFNGISTGNKSYAVNMAGYNAASGSTNVTGNATVDVSLVTTIVNYTIGVMVYDNTSNAISGASVTFNGVTQSTDASGYTPFTGVPAGNIHYTISKAGYISVDDYVNEPGNDPVVVTMTAASSGNTIDFNVYDNASNPIDAASVTFNGVTQYTNASGYTQFTGVPDGSITYEVTKAGYITASGNVTEPGTSPVTVNMTAVGSGLTINFYVYDLSTNYIDGATVTFNGVTQYTDASGTATFTDVPTGNLYYEVSKAGYTSVTGNISEPGNDPIVINLAPAATGLDINFWVYDNQTNPISGASVTFNGITQTTDASGNTIFHDVATGNLYYEVSMAGYYTIYNYVDEPGNDPVVVSLGLLGAAYNVTFNVNDEYGNPVQNATVTFNGSDQSTAANGATQYVAVAESDNYWYNVVKSGYVLSTGYVNVHSDMSESVILMHDYSGLTEISSSVNITTFPNPVKDVVEISSDEKISNLKIFNSTGQGIMNTNVDDTKTNVSMELFPTGLYIIQIQTANNIVSKKIIKE